MARAAGRLSLPVDAEGDISLGSPVTRVFPTRVLHRAPLHVPTGLALFLPRAHHGEIV
jgi:hypothetical protein